MSGAEIRELATVVFFVAAVVVSWVLFTRRVGRRRGASYECRHTLSPAHVGLPLQQWRKAPRNRRRVDRGTGNAANAPRGAP